MGWWALFFAIGLAGTPLARRYAIHRKLLDQPGQRRSHAVATPRGGGLAIVLGLMIAAAVIALRDPQQRVLASAFATGLLLVAGIGMLDDHRPLSPWWRLCVHAVAGLLLAWALDEALASPLAAAAAFVAALALTNVWNFMDGINGLAASQALLLAVAALCLGVGGWTLAAVALAAACAGFLPHNFPRARVFLGDVGSGALGFAAATLTVIACAQQPATNWLLLLPLSAFLLDAGLTLLRRVIRGERWWQPHTQHAYQVWARRAGHTLVTLAYGGWTIIAGGLMMLLRDASASIMISAAGAWYIVGGLLWCLLQRVEIDSVPRRFNLGKDAK